MTCIFPRDDTGKVYLILISIIIDEREQYFLRRLK